MYVVREVLIDLYQNDNICFMDYYKLSYFSIYYDFFYFMYFPPFDCPFGDAVVICVYNTVFG